MCTRPWTPCVHSAETRNNGQDTDVRTFQERPEKETHSAPPNVKEETIETDLYLRKNRRHAVYGIWHSMD